MCKVVFEIIMVLECDFFLKKGEFGEWVVFLGGEIFFEYFFFILFGENFLVNWWGDVLFWGDLFCLFFFGEGFLVEWGGVVML